MVRSFEESVFGVPLPFELGVPFGVLLGVAGAILSRLLVSKLCDLALSS